MNFLQVSLQLTIRSLCERGWSQRRIARELGVDRSTVARYAPAKPASNPTTGSESPKPATGGNNPTTGSPPGPASLCEPRRAVVVTAIEQGLSIQRIFQDLQAEHAFTGSYFSVKRFVRQLSATLALPCRRMETAPGEYLLEVIDAPL